MSLSKEFTEELGALSTDLARANNASFLRRVRDWVSFLRENPESASVIRQLEEGFEFGVWYSTRLISVPSEGGLGDLDLSSSKEERLREYWALFSNMAEGELQVEDFAQAFVTYENEFDNQTREAIEQHFAPFSRDLLKHIRRSQEGEHTPPLPTASSALQLERILTPDTSGPSYRELMDKLEEVRRIAETSNALAATEPEERNRVVAELHAGQTLLKAPRIRVSAVWEVLKGALLWMREKTGETVFAIAVTAALALVAAFLGVPIPGL